METLSHKELIGNLIRKIQNDWERMVVNQTGFSRIDRDILADDLKKVYELVFEMDVVPPAVHPQAEEKTTPEVAPGKETQDEAGQQATTNPGNEAIPEPEIPLVPEKTKEPPYEKKEHYTSPFVQRKAPQQKPQATTLDLFSASKTLADVYQNDGDNSVAAKIQQNKISDIRTAIGINEKFLFINDIFKGEMGAYNRAIDRLNEKENFHEALQLIDELRAVSETEENKVAFNTLTKIVKRKFH
jgi:hypothetical protein